MSPASGNSSVQPLTPHTTRSFHSINVPSEWEPTRPPGLVFLYNKCFHSINVPSEWEPARAPPRVASKATSTSFHSINVPSEWEPQKAYCTLLLVRYDVSIQLMSPASGNWPRWGWQMTVKPSAESFHSINVPSEWEHFYESVQVYTPDVSIQLMSPASGNLWKEYLKYQEEFPFN